MSLLRASFLPILVPVTVKTSPLALIAAWPLPVTSKLLYSAGFAGLAGISPRGIQHSYSHQGKLTSPGCCREAAIDIRDCRLG
jgi:hypothetical protein